MRIRVALAGGALLVSGVLDAPSATAHNCTRQEPRCVEQRTLVQKPERQEIISRVLGHHCVEHPSYDDPNADKREIHSRIGVVFSDVSRHSGYFESFTIYFEGNQRQVMGSVNAYGKRSDVHRFDNRPHDPGYEISYRVDKRVEFGDDVGSKGALGAYTIHHDSAGTPGSGNIEPDCRGSHYLRLTVTPPSDPKCQRPRGPCPPQ